MNSRINSAHVCSIAKVVIHQAKETVRVGTPNVRPSSGKSVICTGKYGGRCTPNQKASPGFIRASSSFSSTQSCLTGNEYQQKFKNNPNNEDKQDKINFHDYFRKFCEDEEKTYSLHLQPNSMRPYGSIDGMYVPAIFKRHTLVPEFKNFSKKSKPSITYKEMKGQASNQSIKCKSIIESSPIKHESVDDNKDLENTPSEKSNSEVSRSNSRKATLKKRGRTCVSPKASKSGTLKLKSKIMKSFTDIAKSGTDLLNYNKNNKSDTKCEIKTVSTKASNTKLFCSELSNPNLLSTQKIKKSSVNLKSDKKEKKCTDKKDAPQIKKCVEICPPKKCSAPLVRLEKTIVPQSPRICPNELKDEPCSRADDSLVLKRKSFKPIAPCPNIPVPVEPKPFVPLKKLPKVVVPEPERPCKTEVECTHRYAQIQIVTKKKLPPLCTGQIPKLRVEMKAPQPLRRLTKSILPEPQKSCLKIDVCETKPRADKEMISKRKHLPPVFSRIPHSPPPRHLKDGARIQRLAMKPTKDDPRVCKEEINNCSHPEKSDINNWTYDTSAKNQIEKLESSLQKHLKKSLPRYILKKDCGSNSSCGGNKAFESLKRPSKCFKIATVCSSKKPLNFSALKNRSSPIRTCNDKTNTTNSKIKHSRSFSLANNELTKNTILPRALKHSEPSDINMGFLELSKQNGLFPNIKSSKSTSFSSLKTSTLIVPVISERVNGSNCKVESVCCHNLPVSNSINCRSTKEPSYCARKTTFQPKSHKNYNTKRSMSTKMFSYSNTGLLNHKTSLFHLYIKKRYSDEASLLSIKKIFRLYEGMSDFHSSVINNCDRDASMKKELQPKYPVINDFHHLEPIKPEAPDMNSEDDREFVDSASTDSPIPAGKNHEKAYAINTKNLKECNCHNVKHPTSAARSSSVCHPKSSDATPERGNAMITSLDGKKSDCHSSIAHTKPKQQQKYAEFKTNKNRESGTTNVSNSKSVNDCGCNSVSRQVSIIPNSSNLSSPTLRPTDRELGSTQAINSKNMKDCDCKDLSTLGSIKLDVSNLKSPDDLILADEHDSRCDNPMGQQTSQKYTEEESGGTFDCGCGLPQERSLQPNTRIMNDHDKPTCEPVPNSSTCLSKPTCTPPISAKTLSTPEKKKNDTRCGKPPSETNSSSSCPPIFAPKLPSPPPCPSLFVPINPCPPPCPCPAPEKIPNVATAKKSVCQIICPKQPSSHKQDSSSSSCVPPLSPTSLSPPTCPPPPCVPANPSPSPCPCPQSKQISNEPTSSITLCQILCPKSPSSREQNSSASSCSPLIAPKAPSSLSCPPPPLCEPTNSSPPPCPCPSPDKIPKEARSRRSFFRKLRPKLPSCPEKVSASSSCPSVIAPTCPPPTPPPCPCPKQEAVSKKAPFPKSCPKITNTCKQRTSLWQRVTTYFKARPNCPPAAVYKRRKMVGKLQKMADKAKMGLYDPCDDPQSICKEVEKRCMEKRNTETGQSRRCFHSYACVAKNVSLPLVQDSFRIWTKEILSNSHNPIWNHRRLISNWKNPFVFYSSELNRSIHGSMMDSNSNQLKYDSLYNGAVCVHNSNTFIDLDCLREYMHRSLFTGIIVPSGTCNDEDIEMTGQNVEYMELRRKLLLELWKRLGQTLEDENTLSSEDVDKTQKALTSLRNILNLKNLD